MSGVINKLGATDFEIELVHKLSRAARLGETDKALQALVQYRERLIRPIIGRALQTQNVVDIGSRDEMVMSRGDCFDVINRARGRK